MANWQFWKSPEKNRRQSSRIRRTGLTLEWLEDRSLLSGPSVGPGYTLTTFATNPSGASQPDSIAVDGANVYVGYGNGVAKDGSDGKSSTIVQYDTAGAVVQTFSVPGHNDGLKVDPETHLLWSLQNEDGNPNLVVIDPAAGTQTNYSFGPVANGGGFDDITFLHDKVYLSESNPANNPNNAPAVVQATLQGTTVMVTPVLFGNAVATNALTKQSVTLNLQDPDSMTANRSGELVLTSQADDELVIIKHPGKSNQSVTLLPLSDAANNPVSVDDTLFRHGGAGQVLLTDLKAGIIYRVGGPALRSGVPLSAAQDIGQLGSVNFDTGVFTPVITGLSSPRGLAFLRQGEIEEQHDEEHDAVETQPAAASEELSGLAAVERSNVVSGLNGPFEANLGAGGGRLLQPGTFDHGTGSFSTSHPIYAGGSTYSLIVVGTGKSGPSVTVHNQAHGTDQSAFAVLASPFGDQQ
jgi:hypothetical protein